MFKSWFKTFDSKQKMFKAQKDVKLVFQRIGRKCRPTQTRLHKIMTTGDNA